MTQNELIMLGTGNAGAIRCYNTCFAIRNNDKYILVDAGGGNGILQQIEKSNIHIRDITDMFITHSHTDHLLGAIWIIRTAAAELSKGKLITGLRVYGNKKVITVISWMCANMLPPKIQSYIGNQIVFCELGDGDSFAAIGMKFECFDIGSKKELQYGLKAYLPNGKSLVTLGDEPYNENNRRYVENCDWLLCEAFCLYSDRDIFKPYEKHHSTALDAGKMAHELGVKNLLLFHTEDKTLATRKQTYTEEAQQEFAGKVYVPEDLERFNL